MLTENELKQLRKLNIVYNGFHALPYGKSKDIGLTELQYIQILLGLSIYKTKQKVREYLQLLDKNCKYDS